jgi:hypothetical protein
MEKMVSMVEKSCWSALSVAAAKYAKALMVMGAPVSEWMGVAEAMNAMMKAAVADWPEKPAWASNGPVYSPASYATAAA